MREAFYHLQAAEQCSGISQQVLDASAARRDAARAMLQAGNVTQLEAASEEAAYERARVESVLTSRGSVAGPADAARMRADGVVL